MSGERLAGVSTARIPVTLVTGFLGSGKTTLINAALRSPDLAKTVIVVNEFGEVGLDQKLFAKSSDSVVVLENGCLCCTVRSDLVGTLNSLFHARQAGEIPFFDNVVIETSGLAEPGPVLQAFLSDPGRALQGRQCFVLGGCGQLAQHGAGARRICAAGRLGRKNSDNQTGSGRRRSSRGGSAPASRPATHQSVSRDRAGGPDVRCGRQAAHVQRFRCGGPNS